MAASVKMPYRQSSTGGTYRKMSHDPREDLRPELDHYIGIDVGTGSARACIMNQKGDIVGLASENIQLWQPQSEYYVSSTTREAAMARYTPLAPQLMSRTGAIHLRHVALYLQLNQDCYVPAQHQS